MNGEHDDLERELRGLRDEPSPEWAAKMDERAAREIAHKPRRRLNLAVLGPVAAGGLAAVLVVAVVAGGGGGGEDSASEGEVLQKDAGGAAELSAPSRQAQPGVPSPGQLVVSSSPSGAAPEGAVPQAGSEAAPGDDESAGARAREPALRTDAVQAGQPLEVTYSEPESSTARVTLTRPGEQRRSGAAGISPGAGTLRIETRGISPGPYRLRVEFRDGELDVPVNIRR